MKNSFHVVSCPAELFSFVTFTHLNLPHDFNFFFTLLVDQHLSNFFVIDYRALLVEFDRPQALLMAFDWLEHPDFVFPDSLK